MNPWQWISTLAAGFIGSWLGGWIGVRSHKSQRSFELRVAWYRDAIDRINTLLDQLMSAKHASERGNEDECSRMLGMAMRTVSVEFVPEIVRGRIFGTPATIRSIDRYISEFGKEEPDDGFTKDKIGFYDRMMDRLTDLRQRLVDDCRSVMSYEREPLVKIKSIQ